MTHLSYQTSVRLKKFLGKSCPETISGKYWTPDCNNEIGEVQIYGKKGSIESCDIPQYSLQDILSKRFCKALAHKCNKTYAGKTNPKNAALLCHINLALSYWKGGFPAVEVEINRLIKEE